MKKLFLFAVSVCCIQAIYAQCTSCTPFFSGCQPTGGLCNKADTGMANHPYTFTYQFYMPHNLTDPTLLAQCSGCNYIRLREVKITGIGGLPAGINSYNFNHNQLPQYPGYYNVNANDTMGCATICGTPLAAGVYPIQVYMTAEVTAVGTPIGDVDATSQTFYPDTLIIKPDTSGGVSSFTYGGVREGCGSVDVYLEASLQAQAPNPTSWRWNINGQQSSTLAPGAYSFNQPGAYDISLRTTFYQFRVKRIHVKATGGWTGDIEELTSLSKPELYILEGSLGINTSNSYTADDDDVIIDIPASTPYLPIGTNSFTFNVWDKDNGPPLGSNDDDLGSFSINVGQAPSYPHQFPYSGANANGWVEIDTVGTTSIIDTLHVLVKEGVAYPQIIRERDSICMGDSVLLKASPYCANCTYIWHRDSITYTNTNDSLFYASESGVYWLWVSNQISGCTNQNDSAFLFYVSAQPAAQTIVYNPSVNKVYPLSSTSGFSIKWYKDGEELAGQTGSSVVPTGSGTYKIVVYNPSLPECAAEAELFVSTSGISDINEFVGVNVLPNPNNGKFRILITDAAIQNSELFIRDMLGRIVYTDHVDINSDRTEKEIDLEMVNKGVYLLSISINEKQIIKKVVVE